jgi:hypothetical protein
MMILCKFTLHTMRPSYRQAIPIVTKLQLCDASTKTNTHEQPNILQNEDRSAAVEAILRYMVDFSFAILVRYRHDTMTSVTESVSNRTV